MNEIVVRETNEMVETMQKKYMEAYNTGDMDGLMDLYTEDAIFSPWIGPFIKGKQELRSAFVMIKKDFATLNIQCLQVDECGDRPFNIGLFTFMNDKGDMIASGNYLNVYKQEQNAWKIYINTINKHSE